MHVHDIARLRLRARPAHHAEVDRQQPGHQGGDDSRGDRRGDQAARRLRAALRQAVRGHARRSASPARSRSRACRPHRSLSLREPDPLSETEAAKDADAPNFEQSILDNLAKAGIQNGRRQERIAFDGVRDLRGRVHPGDRAARRRGGRRRASRIAIAIGPQYGTVSPSYVKKAAREAIDAEDVDLLSILGFAFDPQVTA